MKQAQRTSQLLIADSSPLFCRGLRALLSAELDFKVIDVVCVKDEILAKVRLFVPDVLIIDARLLRSDDPQFGVTLRQTMANGSILALTESDNEECLAGAVAAGVKGYMLKSSTPAQLTEGVRQIAFSNGSNPLQIPKIVPDLKALAAQNQIKSQAVVLTARESEIVRLLGEGKIVREVAVDLGVSMKTVEAHKLNLMRKLDIHHRAALVEYAVQHGLISAPTAY